MNDEEEIKFLEAFENIGIIIEINGDILKMITSLCKDYQKRIELLEMQVTSLQEQRGN